MPSVVFACLHAGSDNIIEAITLASGFLRLKSDKTYDQHFGPWLLIFIYTKNKQTKIITLATCLTD